MSLMRINHIQNEIKKLTTVIQNLITNYDNNFKEYDSQILELDNLKSLAQFQNELMLVKHMALLENMIINIFRCLVNLLQKQEYQQKYFIDIENFSDSFIASNKIKELTNGKIDLKKIKFWYLYETMRTIRNSIAHGEPLFIISYNRIKKFNKNIDIIVPYSEINEDEHTKNMYPSLLHPTYENKSKWFCHLSNNTNNLSELNKQCLEFVEKIKQLYLSYGNEKKISDHELYGCKTYNKY